MLKDAKRTRTHGRPEKEGRLGNGDSDKDTEAAEKAEDGGNVGESKDEIEKKEGTEADRKAQQGAEVKLLLKGGEHDGHDLPHEADAPEDDGQVLPLGAGGDDIGVDARADTNAETDEAIQDKSDGACAEFERAKAGAEAVDEDAPAEPGQGRILRARERAEESAGGGEIVVASRPCRHRLRQP